MNTRLGSISRHLLRITGWLLGVSLSLWGTLTQADEGDPASRVARISYLNGQVYVQTNDDDAWTAADINQPLTSGDELRTDHRARTELQLGGTTLQVDADTQLRLLELSDEVLQVQVTQGVVNVRARSITKRDTVEIDTPTAAVSVMQPGSYRIEVADRDNATVVKVREGSVDVSGERQNFSLRANEQLSLRGDDRLLADIGPLAGSDEFDRWSDERNRRAERVVSSRYVADDVIGYEDLDDYGNWRWYGDYGYVWTPTRIVSGWAPYRYGRWSWVGPWGWTWIDDSPWGFAPFHYGRWTTIGNRWCWVPGPRSVRAVYAPALVAWIGTPGVSLSVNIGTRPVGWIPLGPREVYRPAYRGSHDYIVRVNVSNSRLNHDEFERDYRRQPHENDYRNHRAASVVPADALRGARPVDNQLIRQPAGRLQPLAGMPVEQPSRNERATAPRINPSFNNNSREVVARRRPDVPNGNNGMAPSVRVLEPRTWQRSGNDNTNGRGIDSRNDANERNSVEPMRAPNNLPDVTSPNRENRSVAPFIRPERPEPSVRSERSINTNRTEERPEPQVQPHRNVPGAWEGRRAPNVIPNPGSPPGNTNRAIPERGVPNSPAALAPDSLRTRSGGAGMRDEGRLNPGNNAQPSNPRSRALAPAPNTANPANSNRSRQDGDGPPGRRMPTE